MNCRGILQFAALGMAWVAATASGRTFTLESGDGRLVVDERGSLVELVNGQTGWNWAGGAPMWRLYFDRRYTPEGTPVAAMREEREICVEAGVQQPVIEKSGSALVLRYSQLKVRGEFLPIKLSLTISPDADGAFRFAASIDNQLPHSIVREFHYPLVGDMRLPKDAELLHTLLGGKRIKNPIAAIAKPDQVPLYMGPDHKFRQLEYVPDGALKYPSHTTANCYAFITDTEGLYFGSHDATFQDTIHGLRCWPNAAGIYDRLEAGLYKYPNVLSGKVWQNDSNVIKPYCGNWTETAKTYRRWANTWWKKRSAPKWVRQMTGWQRIIFRHQYGETLFTPSDLNGRILKAGADAGLDTVICFGWWRRGMDNGCPDSYFEAEPDWGGDAGWQRAIADYRAKGNNFLLYFNGKLIDTESDYYKKGPGKQVAYRTSTGEVYTEQYRFAGTGTFTKFYNARTFASADHREPIWMQFLEKAVDKAIEYGASGVFFDQLGYCEPGANWDVSGEFAIPNTRTIAAKAEALSHLRDYIEAKGLSDFALGTECFVDCCAQSVDYMHNLIGATEPDDFTDWARYAFPECVITDREIRDERNIPWRVNHNLLVGLRADAEIYRCRGLIDETPAYQRRTAAINRLRRKYPVLMEGDFMGTDGLTNSRSDELLANVFSDKERLCVVACTARDKTAAGVISVKGWRPVAFEGIDAPKVTFDGEAAVLDLPVNALAVIEFVR